MKRIFLWALILTSFTASSQTATTKPINVNQQRLEQRIFELAKFGKDSTGKGYRVAYTKADQEGRAYFISLMKQAGLEVTIDYAGNIIGKKKEKMLCYNQLLSAPTLIWCLMAATTMVALVLLAHWK